MRASKAYKKAIEQAKTNYADLMERGEAAVGADWDDIRTELFTPEEIAESDLRVALIGELVKARDEKVISQKEFEDYALKVENGEKSPRLDTLFDKLVPLGKTLAIVPLENKLRKSRPIASVFNVAQYVLEKIGETTALKLQKLVYYCQAWSLAWDGDKLFDEDFEAWANGPVCRKLFEFHRREFTIFPSELAEYKYDGFTKEQIETMDKVIEFYNKYTPQELSDLTHQERPWREARGNCRPGDKCSNIIPKETMQDYYAGLENF